ncbi:alkaline phosphatase family protein [Anaerolineae bacterium CFX9]|nr:alkaline phosphatase family protein [Anaerolineae bacterium CFX9]
MAEIRNVLFIMVDQMRADCLSIDGHPVVQTPNLDRLAKRGVRFSRAYVQTAVCGPSRACFYTGRYTHAHGTYWNEIPLAIDEQTLGQVVRNAGVRAALCGKTHMTADEATLERLQVVESVRERLRHAGFEPWEVNDFWGEGWMQHLHSRGYDLPFENPMLAAFQVTAPDGARRNGWRFENCRLPTVYDQADSDTAFMTDRAMAFIDDAGDAPWLLHLSYLKPHWPNVAPVPYNTLYDPADVPAPNRAEHERTNPHPILQPFREERRGLALDDEQTWRNMRATYYGLITEIDTHIGRLMAHLEARGRLEDTLIIFVSDHGEYMGDHWLFEKELFYEEAIRVPLIIVDPDPRADGTRGSVQDVWVESIDLMPTCLEALNISIPPAVQGRSLLGIVRGAQPDSWRDAVFGDWDFRFYRTSAILRLPVNRCRAWMIRDEAYKYVHFNGLPDMLFDLRQDPSELCNLAEDPSRKEVIAAYRERLLAWRQATEDDRLGKWLEAQMGRAGVYWVPDDIF